tara:strand:- start:92 stop:403 length:312 start_codon:yes stop_codon:yes gene_type:complete
MLIKLLADAPRCMRPNGAITISAAREYHLIEPMVQSAGVGMSAEHLLYLFERFYKVGRSLRDVRVGLSLAIVQQIIGVNGAQAWAYYKESVGRAFGFTFPAEQ